MWVNCERLNAEILDSAGPQLKAIVTGTAGFDYVDISEIEKRGIRFGYTPNVPNDAVADLAIGLMIAAARRFTEGYRKIVDQHWQLNDPSWMLGQDIKGSTVGIVGFGRIGQVIARRLTGFEVAKIIYSGNNEKEGGFYVILIVARNMNSKSSLLYRSGTWSYFCDLGNFIGRK